MTPVLSELVFCVRAAIHILLRAVKYGMKPTGLLGHFA